MVHPDGDPPRSHGRQRSPQQKQAHAVQPLAGGGKTRLTQVERPPQAEQGQRGLHAAKTDVDVDEQEQGQPDGAQVKMMLVWAILVRCRVG